MIKSTLMEFNMPKDNNKSSIIKVIGVGGGGGNAVNYMYGLGIHGVDYVVCNTDLQALEVSPVPTKIQLGPNLTEGRGAGAIPEIGKRAVEESIEGIKEFLEKDTKMVFVTAGMGGGTGTGAAPVIAKLAKDMGILTVGIVTVPFNFEGRRRRQQAEAGLDEMRNAVDTLLVINNERLREIHGNLTLSNAFAEADNIVSTAAKGIAEVISLTGAINVDFNDVSTVMKDSGNAILGSGLAEGENRAIEAVQKALTSPLLNENDIAGAKYVLLNITYSSQNEASMDEISDITDYIQDEAGSTADVIWGHGFDDSLEDKICVTIIATGFNVAPVTGFERAPERTVKTLVVDNEAPTVEQAPVVEVKNEEQEFVPFLKTTQIVDEVKPDHFTHTPVVNETPQTLENNAFEAKQIQDKVEFNWDLASSNDVQEHKETPAFETKVDEPVAAQQEVKRFNLMDEEAEEEQPDLFGSAEERLRRSKERLDRISTYTSKLKKPDGLAELEKEPAFKRRSVELDDVPHSSESQVSRFGLFSDEDGSVGLKGDNSFLHDNVD
jgi:cell division protein FtsZ